MSWRVRFCLQTSYRPAGLPLDPEIEAVDYVRLGSLPFVPVAGMDIDCGDGDYRAVERVLYATKAVQGAHFTVFFEDCDAQRPHQFMLDHGWALE
jgi:hypothetical protein